MQTNHYINLLAQAEKLRRHNRQGSFKTKERYFEAFKRFLRYLAETYRLEKIANISGKHLSSYVEYMQENGLSVSTVKTDLAALRFWHDQIPNAKYVLPSNDEFELERRSFGKIDRTWSECEFNLMLEECTKTGHEDFKACIVIARYAGLRLHETMRVGTAIARLALKNGYITIKGKGGKIRQVPINEEIQIEFDKFPRLTPAGCKLFVPEGKKTHIAKIELQNFINKHRKYVQDKDSTKPMTFHGLRHNFASESYLKLISEGKSEYKAEKLISLWLGHERPEITRIYLASLRGSDADVSRVSGCGEC